MHTIYLKDKLFRAVIKERKQALATPHDVFV